MMIISRFNIFLYFCDRMTEQSNNNPKYTGNMKEGWEYKKLGEVASIKSGKSIDAKNISSELQYPCYGGNGIRGYVQQYSYEGSFPIIGRVGALCGNVHLANGRFYATEHALVVELKNKNVNSLWLTYNLKSLNLRNIAKGVAQPVIAAKEVAKIIIPIPPLSEQQRIVEELDLLSSIIEKKKAQLKELDSLAQSIFYNMYGDIENNSKSFGLQVLGDVCNLKAGKAIKADELHDKDETLYPCYGGNGIRGYIDRYSHSGKFPIIGRQGALCGNVNFAVGKFYATEHAVVVTPLIDINTIWLYYLLKAMNLGQYAHGVAQPGLSVKDLQPLSIPLPPLPLQLQFAEKVEAIERQKELIKQSIKEVETLFNSRMDYYFDG